MFDVSWTDPTRETVGERKNRKESRHNQGNDLEKISSSRGSNSNGYHSQNRPSLLTLFGVNGSISNNKKGLKRSGSHSRLSTSRSEEKVSKASRRISSYTVDSASSEPELLSRISVPPTNFFAIDPFLCPTEIYHLNAEQSCSASDGEGKQNLKYCDSTD